MPAVPLPQHESRRLAVLEEYEVLDTPAEEAFDEIVFLAALICDTPVALVSLIDDDRQWFKARVGLDVPEHRRDLAFCAHAILEPDRVLVVPDATADERFASNPLVTGEPGVRFYAGAPLATPEGLALGTVCVVDYRPRRPTDDQERALGALARQVMAQLELRRHVTILERRERHREALERQRRRLERAVRETTELSLTDQLTGIANRRSLEAGLASACTEATITGEAVSVALLDLDHFKQVNDVRGHSVGDAVLANIAAVLESEARDTDLVGRYGGDEFMVVFPRTEAAGARAVAERIRRAVEGAGARTEAVTVSIGLVTAYGTADRRSLVDLADRALYRAKAAGGNCIATAFDLAEPLDAKV